MLDPAHDKAASLAAPADPWIGVWWGACMGAWLLGVAWQLQRSQLGTVLSDGAVVLAVLAWWGVAQVWRHQRHVAVRRVLWCLAWGLAGWSVANGHAHWRLSQALPSALEGRDIVLSGVVAGLPQHDPQGLRFVLEVDAQSLVALQRAVSAKAPMLQRSMPRRLALSWFQGSPWSDNRATPSNGPQVPKVRAGERWQLTVRLRKPHGLFNPHGFDRELSLFEQGVRATGTVRAGHRVQSDAGHRLHRWRQWVRDGIEATVFDARAAGVLTALAVGDQGAIETVDWDVFRLTGVAHLMSISGINVSLERLCCTATQSWLGHVNN